PYSAFKTHGPEFTAWPGDGELWGFRATGQHRHRTEAVGFPDDHGPHRYGERSASYEQVTERPDTWFLFCLDPDHKAGGVDKGDDWQPMILGEGQVLGHRPCGVNIDRSAEMVVVIGDNRNGLTVNAPETGDGTGPELLPNFSERSRVYDRGDRIHHGKRPEPIRRHDRASGFGELLVDIRGSNVRILLRAPGSGERGQCLFHMCHRFGLVLCQDVNDTVG